MHGTRLLAPAALAVALMPACSTTTSRVTGLASAAGAAARPTPGTLWVDLDAGLRAGLRATDLSAPGDAAPAFRLEIEFRPRALGYVFDAGQLALRDAAGAESRPVGETGGYRPLVEGARVSVRFDRPVGDGERLELVVAGAAVGQRRIEPVTVALSRVERREQKPSAGLVGVGKVAGKVVGGLLSMMLAASGGGI